MFPLIGGLFTIGNKILDIVDKHIKDKQLKQQLSLEIQKLYTEEALKLQQQMIQSQSDVIVAEATGHSWLQRNWRPITMLVFVFIIANNYVLVPYAHAIFKFQLPVLNLPPDVWEIIKYGLTGYIGARSVEKVTSIVTANKLAKQVSETISVSDSNKAPKVTNLSLENDEL